MFFAPIRKWLVVAAAGLFAACHGSSPPLNQTSITCTTGRTLLDGVCVSESVADYVACVRAQGAQLGGSKREQISAEVGTVGVKAGAAAEVSEKLEKKYAASDAAMLEIVRRCSNTAPGSTPVTAPTPSPVAATPPPSCRGLEGQWVRETDGLPFVITAVRECELLVEIPGTGFVHTLRATAKGNELNGLMTRRNRTDGCTVHLRLRLVLVGDRIRETVDGVEGQCDIGPDFREAHWLDRTK